MKVTECNTTTLLSEWLKSRILTPPNAGKAVEHRNSDSLLVGMQNSTATLDDICLSYKTSIVSPYHPATALLGTYPDELQIYVQTKICTEVCSSFIYNCENLAATKISFDRFHPSIHIMEYCSVIKRKELSRHGRNLNAYC